MRLKGVSWGAMTSFAFNTMIGQVTPIAITSIGWVRGSSSPRLERSANLDLEILRRLHCLQFDQRDLLLVLPA